MGHLVLITGGARSGKSTFAENMARGLNGHVLYIATAIPFDEEMKDRVAKHRRQRPANWDTYEGYQGLERALQCGDYQVVLLDCVTVMISNLMLDVIKGDDQTISVEDTEQIETGIRHELKNFLDEAEKHDATIIMVTNEVGYGIVPENRLGRIFRDIAGRMNQYIASRATEVYLIVCGLPLQVK